MQAPIVVAVGDYANYSYRQVSICLHFERIIYDPDMNFIRLSVFREVMQTGSLSQAARNLGRTQPAVSLSLKALEDQIGFSLFERRGKSLVPVPEARHLLAEAEEILDRVASMSRTADSLKDTRQGSLVLAAMPGPSSTLFPRYVSSAMHGRRRVRISISSRSTEQIRELVATQSIDFGFADAPPPGVDSPRYSVSVVSGRCFCALPACHPLARKKLITPKDLDGARLGTLQPNHQFFKRLREAFDSAGAKLNVGIHSQIFLPLLQFVANDQCLVVLDPLSVATEHTTRSMRGRVEFRKISPPMLYDYATYVPAIRPMSRLASQVMAGWQQELENILVQTGAKAGRERD